jgi:T5SS/PEP-CTERM-associated repeat protein
LRPKKLAGLILGFVTGIVLSSQPSHAQYTANYQTNIISGVTSNWSGDYVVGSNTFADVLFIDSGGILSNVAGRVGYEVSSSNNSVLVTDSGSVWSNSSTLLIGWSGSHSSLTISNGGQVINFGPGGYYSGIGGNSSSNRVEVTGAGSTWRCRSDALYVGNNGASNSLVIRNGGNLVGGSGGAIGAGLTSSNNSVLVTDIGSVWSNLGVSIGSGGWGNRLVVSNGGRVLSSGNGRVGGSDFIKFGNNSALVTGSGSVWSNGGDWQVGGYMWGNSVIVNNGGLLFNFHGYVGAYPTTSSNNSMVVSDAGSVWTNLGDVRVGSGGTRNSLTVSNGAKVFDGFGYLGDGPGGSNNSAVVTGSGSVWTNWNDLNVGREGRGNSLAILSSGAVYSTFGYIGNGTSAASNSVVVAGTGSVWRIVNFLYVGHSGPGNSLVISNGGRVVSGFNDSCLGCNTSSSNNSILITGPGSVWSNGYGYSLSIGYSGAGNSLVINNGGKVLMNNGTIGINSSASNNSVLVTDSGSVWSNTGALSIGWSGSRNSLVISNGGEVVSGPGFVGYNSPLGSSNRVVVTGTGSVWKIDANLGVGLSGSGNSLTIINGGVVSDNYGSVGVAGIKNSVLVTGAGSIWSNAAGLFIGTLGFSHSLVISNGGRVVNSTGSMGNLSSSNVVRVADAAVWQNDELHVGETGSSNSLVVAGGTVFATNLVIGFNSSTCDNWVQLDSGSLVVTNATHDATLEVRNGTFIFNGGVLQVDRFVMTNPCAQFIRTGGTLVLDPNLDTDGDGMPNGWEQSHGLDPLNAADANADADGDGMSNLQEYLAGTDPTNSASAFRIIEVAAIDDDVLLTWTTVGGKKYAMQSVTGGDYTNAFIEFAPAFIAPGTNESTFSVIHPGGATNSPSRFYRVRLVP